MAIADCSQSSLSMKHCIHESLSCLDLAVDMQLNGEPVCYILNGCGQHIREPTWECRNFLLHLTIKARVCLSSSTH